MRSPASRLWPRLLVTAAGTRAAFVGPGAGARPGGLRYKPQRAAAATPGLPAASSSLLVCDRSRHVCSLHAAPPAAAPPSRARSDTPYMQQVECPDPATAEMGPQYSPADVEQRLYAWWEESGFFKPGGDESKECFVISMPPPNVTGKLHMGHAMFVALEDIMARFHRMRGRPTLWLPGTDHAGIATQMLVERALRAEGVERADLGRDKFVDRVWGWKEEYGGQITEQVRRLGASCDWSRERFTLEPDLCNAVNEAFVRLHEKGLVYRGEYMVNWSPSLGTAVSDLEVEYVEEEGKLYYFKYVLDGGDDEHIAVATTRPETILGDTAVCVHPEDKRYEHLVGKRLKVPMSDRTIPVVADDYVEMEFGTGALKVTPAHDVNDYEIGKRHNLDSISVMNKDATMSEAGGAYAGLDRFDAREKLWADMEAAGLTIKVEPHTQRVPRSQRGGEVIEPLVSTQWFVKMDGMAKKGLDAVRDGEITILPQRFEKVYNNWLENIQDWCVSRQLWWGHRIPVWYASGHNDKYYVARSEDAARKLAEAELGPGVVLTQDEDVLDTWFSSGLWPFATVGWPDKTADLAKFYPSSVMETGYDILFFWVARMVMMGLEFTGKSPFHTIYLHGLVRDEKGAKMSKTKGNVVDPIETIGDIGADALRLALVTGVTPGQDVPLSASKLQANRNFANKLWNTCRYLVRGLEDLPPDERQALAVVAPLDAAELATLPLPERWVVSRVHTLAGDVTAQLEGYDFGPAGQAIYSFLWDEFADWYIEISKPRIAEDPSGAAAQQSRRVLVYVLDTCLRLLHPYMPFITEELWGRLPHEGKALMIASWPQRDATPLARDEAAEAEFSSVQALVRAIRNARADYRVAPGKQIGASIVATPALAAALRTEAPVIAGLARVATDSFGVVDAADAGGVAAEEKAAAGGQAVKLVVEEGLEAYLPLAELVDAEKERARLSKQAAKLEKEIGRLEGRLASPGFVDKAPPPVVAKARDELREQKEQLDAVRRSLEQLPA